MKSRVMACLFALCCASTATSVIPVSVERLARESSHVVEATAEESWSQWNAQHTLIFTYTKFQVSRSLKGQAPATVIVKQLGGSAGGYTQKVAGVRHWRSGEQAVLFLQPGKSTDGSFEITGLVQGSFVIRTTNGQKIVSNGLRGVATYSQSTAGTYRGSTIPLEELESRVQKAGQP